MSEMVHTHKVNICGENFQIKSDVKSSEIEKIAGYVDYKIKELDTTQVTGDKLKISILAAMNIAGELFEARSKAEDLESFKQNTESKAKSLNKTLDMATGV